MSDAGKVFDLRQNADKSYGKSYTTTEQIGNFVSVALKVGFLFIFLTVNFLGLSVALNCNANSKLSVKIMSAIFGFFFGIVSFTVDFFLDKAAANLVNASQIPKVDCF